MWLRKFHHGTYVATIKFKIRGSLQVPTIQSASLHEFFKEYHHRQAIFAFCVHPKIQSTMERLHNEMQSLIDQYSDVFDVPNKLPLGREVDHTIPLEGGIKDINVRPYRYAHFQKSLDRATSPRDARCGIDKTEYWTFFFLDCRLAITQFTSGPQPALLGIPALLSD